MIVFKHKTKGGAYKSTPGHKRVKPRGKKK